MITSRAFFRLEFSVFEDSFSQNFHHTTNSDRLRSKLCKMLAASFTGFSKAQWGAARNGARELETSEKHERGMTGTSVERERGVIPLSLIINSNIPKKVIASDWRRGRNIGDNWRS